MKGFSDVGWCSCLGLISRGPASSILAVASILAGCAQQQACVKPQIVKVTVTKYVPIPVELIAPVALPKPQDATVVECVRVNIQRAAAIGQCNAQLDAIKKLQPQVQP